MRGGASRRSSCSSLQHDLLPQFILGFLGMPRRYHVYPPEFQMLNVLSTAGRCHSWPGIPPPGLYLACHLQGEARRRHPWGATGLSGKRRPRRPTFNFEQTRSCGRRRTRTTLSWRGTVSEHSATSRTNSTMPSQQYEASTLGMWAFLITEIMFSAPVRGVSSSTSSARLGVCRGQPAPRPDLRHGQHRGSPRSSLTHGSRRAQRPAGDREDKCCS